MYIHIHISEMFIFMVFSDLGKFISLLWSDEARAISYITSPYRTLHVFLEIKILSYPLYSLFLFTHSYPLYSLILFTHSSSLLTHPLYLLISSLLTHPLYSLILFTRSYPLYSLISSLLFSTLFLKAIIARS